MRNNSFFLASHSCLDPAPREAAPGMRGGGGGGGKDERGKKEGGGVVRSFILA